MAAERQTSVSSCCNCQVCKERYSKLQEKRNVLRRAVKLYEQQFDKIQADNLRLEKAYETEKGRVEIEKEGRGKELAARAVLETEIATLKSEITALQIDKERRSKELAARAALETEIATLKSEITVLQQKGVSHAQDRQEEVKELQVLVSEREKEIIRLKDLLGKEKKKVDSEKKIASEEKKKALEAWKFVKIEKGKADEERKIADIERRKVEEYRVQLEALRKETDDAKSKLDSGMLKLEEESKELEAVKQNVAIERKRADLEMAKAEEQRRLAEANWKQAEEVRIRAEKLCLQLKESGRSEELEEKICELVKPRRSSDVGDNPNKLARIESTMDQGPGMGKVSKSVEQSKRIYVEKKSTISKRKLAKAEKDKLRQNRKLDEQSQKKVMEDKCHVSHLSQQLEEARGKIEELQKQIVDISQSKPLVKVSSEKCTDTEFIKVKDLKRQLKFEKMRVKNAKGVAKLEKCRNAILQQELGCLKLDFVQFMHRLVLLDKYFSPHSAYLGKKKVKDNSDMQLSKKSLSSLEPHQMHLQKEKDTSKLCYTCITGSVPRQSEDLISPMPSFSGANCCECISGIVSKDFRLESLLGDSRRKMLKSSAINSISASFSDAQLVGSQERGALSVTTSSKMIEEGLNGEPTDSCMPRVGKRKTCNGNHAVVAENSVRSPLKFGEDDYGSAPSQKRKRTADAMESIASLWKLHQQMEERISDLHDTLNKKVVKCSKNASYFAPDPQEITYSNQNKLCKKRKTSHRESEGICNLSDKNELMVATKSDVKVHEEASRPASQHATNLDKHLEMPIEGVSDIDYMKLLDMDDPADEERYRAAIAMPISPTLPVIPFKVKDRDTVDDIKSLHQEKIKSCLSNEKKNPGLLSCSDVTNMEINSNGVNRDVLGTSHYSLLHENERPVDSFFQEGEFRNDQDLGLGHEIVIRSLHGSRNEVVEMSESALEIASDSLSNHFIVVHDIQDNNSISRVFCATRTCLTRCSLATHKGSGLLLIFHALKMEGNLLPKEKACVLLSLLLINFSAASPRKYEHCLSNDLILCLDSLHADFGSVLSDAEAGNVFEELCLDEFLRFIESFLLDGRVIKCIEGSSQMSLDCISIIHLSIDGVDKVVQSVAVSTDQLVAGGIILASICTATDHVGFLCEASYNIFRGHQCDLSLSMVILHIFAYLGGEKYFNTREHNLTMTVLEAIVACIEMSSSGAVTPYNSSTNQIRAKFHPCTMCPFSKDKVCIDTTISLLQKQLWAYAQPITMNVLSHKAQAQQSCPDQNCDASCSLDYSEISASKSDSIVNVNLCHFFDVLSLVELLACYMSWNLTCGILHELLRLLESIEQESFTVAIIILLGQLGRLGVDACGYEDKEVDGLRSKLSAFLLQCVALPVQIATVTALLGIMPIKFDQIVQMNAKQPITNCQPAPAEHIRKWFYSLSKDNQTVSFNLLRSPGTTI